MIKKKVNIDAKGAAEAEILVASYNEKYNNKLDYKEYTARMYDNENDLLYLPHSSTFG